MRLIDADALAKFIDYGHLNNPDEKLYSENDIREMIDMMPSIDAVQVVRCKDCLFNDGDGPNEDIKNTLGEKAAEEAKRYCERMSDLISKQEAIEAIGALSDTIFKNIEKGATYPPRAWFAGMASAESIIEGLPSIDAVQVVQCKDCLFNDGDGPNEDDKYWCALHQSFMKYCSDAERKE